MKNVISNREARSCQKKGCGNKIIGLTLDSRAKGCNRTSRIPEIDSSSIQLNEKNLSWMFIDKCHINVCLKVPIGKRKLKQAKQHWKAMGVPVYIDKYPKKYNHELNIMVKRVSQEEFIVMVLIMTNGIRYLGNTWERSEDRKKLITIDGNDNAFVHVDNYMRGQMGAVQVNEKISLLRSKSVGLLKYAWNTSFKRNIEDYVSIKLKEIEFAVHLKTQNAKNDLKYLTDKFSEKFGVVKLVKDEKGNPVGGIKADVEDGVQIKCYTKQKIDISSSLLKLEEQYSYLFFDKLYKNNKDRGLIWDIEKLRNNSWCTVRSILIDGTISEKSECGFLESVFAIMFYSGKKHFSEIARKLIAGNGVIKARSKERVYSSLRNMKKANILISGHKRGIYRLHSRYHIFIRQAGIVANFLGKYE